MKSTTKKTLLLMMTFMLSACATTEVSAQAPADPCKNLNKPNKPLQLQLDQFEVVLKRKKKMCLDLRQIKTEMFRIRVDAGDSGYTWNSGPITVEGKSPAVGNPVISGSNSAADPDTVVVTVKEPSVQPPNSSDYDYWIKVPGVGTLDPKVRIIRQNIAPLWAQDVEMALMDLGLTLEDIGLNREDLERRLEMLLNPQKQTQSY